MVNLRKATIEDGAFILEVRNHESTLKQLHDPRKFDLNSFEAWFNNSNPEWFIIESENQKIGYIRTKWIEKPSVLQIGADIHPVFRGKGFSKSAYYKLFDLFFDAKKFTLEVFLDNEIAHKLYKKLGFIEIDRYEFYIDNNPRTSIVMEKLYK
jgi:RimJ/RimL family protein N-acetyltransferase